MNDDRDDSDRHGSRHEGGDRRRGDEQGQLDELYARLERDAARLLLVHESGSILRSTHDPEELADGLLGTIAEAVFAATGCVARLRDEELDILAHRGLDDAEIEELTSNPREAALWFEVAEAGEDRIREEVTETGASRPAFELYIPLEMEGDVIGVVALGRRIDGESFSDADRQLAVSLASQLAVGLTSAELFSEKEERIEQLNVLLQISREITSTLDIERVMGTIAQMFPMVLPNRRTTIALAEGQAVAVRATSDPDFDPREEEMEDDPLLPALRWAHGARQSVNTSRSMLEYGQEADGRDVLLPVLNRDDGPRGLAILPLADEEGTLGLLAIETDEDEPPLEGDVEELVNILANQATVAIRNAQLYQRVPMIGMLEPLLGKSKGKRAKGAKRRLLRWGAVAAVLVLGFTVPAPACVSGDAVLRPDEEVSVRAGTAGTVESVEVVEGESVEGGQVVARLRRDELEVDLDRIEAASRRARAEARSARQRGDMATYRARQAELESLAREQEFLVSELSRTRLVAPEAGVVLTPKVELRDGVRLARGETFLTMADVDYLEAVARVEEAEIFWIEPGSSARVKVHSYPGRTFQGEVVRIAPRVDEDATVRVTVGIDNPDRVLRPGMTGRARIDAPWRPVLTRFFRPLLNWFRTKLWF